MNLERGKKISESSKGIWHKTTLWLPKGSQAPNSIHLHGFLLLPPMSILHFALPLRVNVLLQQ